MLEQVDERLPRVAYHRHRGADVPARLEGIHVEVYDLGARARQRPIRCDDLARTGADDDGQVRLGEDAVGDPTATVPAAGRASQHTDAQRVRIGNSPTARHRGGDRDTVLLGQLHDLAPRLGQDA